jgi:ABC-type lipoprotein export system ATPase subunit/ABC-type antimicrobial peptide transport system permease subunit
MELIRIDDIYKTYHLGEVDVPVLKGITLAIHRGEMVALMGASGSGKTTLMNLLGCLDRPTSGHYWFDGVDVAELAPGGRAVLRSMKLGFVFQCFNLLARTNAVANVLMPLDYAPKRPTSRDSLRRACVLLDRVGLGDRFDHEPSQMSGGQQQRVAIARSLVNQPALLLADEPTGNLDSRTSAEILQMFQRLNAEGITIILVTHDPAVAKYAHRVIRLHDGRIVEDGPAAEVLAVIPEGAHAGDLPTGRPSDGDGQGNGDGQGDGDGVLGATAGSSGRADLTPGRASGGTPGRKSPGIAPGISPSPAAVSGVAAVLAEIEPAAEPETVPPEEMVSTELAKRVPRAGLFSGMPPTLRTALNSLRRNKLRSALTTLGVIIGVGAVITMMEIGQGSKAALQATIASMGADNLLIQSGAASSGGVSYGMGTTPTLMLKDADKLMRECPAVSNVAVLVRARCQVVYGHKNWVPTYIYGVSPAFLAVRDWEKLDEGEAFTEHDVRNSSKVCLVGETIVREVFGGQSPLGKEIRMQNVSFRVIGVLEKKGANMMGMDQDDIVLAPWTTIKYRVAGTMLTNTNQSAASAGSSGGNTSSSGTTNPSVSAATGVNTLMNLYPGTTGLYSSSVGTEQADLPQPIRFANVDQIYCKAITQDRMDDAQNQITATMRLAHRLRKDQDDDFNIRNMADLVKTMSSSSELMGTLLVCVATISLVVGGVGIMNIMLVSVTERTREIGLRMAVGAKAGHILQQFLVEAVVLCLLGGAIGIVAGRTFSCLVRWWKHWPIETSLPAIIVAVLVSAFVGVVFGFYPAYKASGLDPIEALRYE